MRDLVVRLLDHDGVTVKEIARVPLSSLPKNNNAATTMRVEVVIENARHVLLVQALPAWPAEENLRP